MLRVSGRDVCICKEAASSAQIHIVHVEHSRAIIHHSPAPRKEAGSVRSYKRQHNNVYQFIPLTHSRTHTEWKSDTVLLMAPASSASSLVMMIYFLSPFQLQMWLRVKDEENSDIMKHLLLSVGENITSPTNTREITRCWKKYSHQSKSSNTTMKKCSITTVLYSILPENKYWQQNVLTGSIVLIMQSGPI